MRDVSGNEGSGTVNKIKNLLFLSLALALCLIGAPVTAKAARNQSGALACTFQGAWLEDANCTSNRSTVYTVGNGELRTGYYNGVQYGWGRLEAGDYELLHFQVDLDGDRVPDEFQATSGAGNFTWAYPASASSDRAFRVCVYDEDYQLETRCTPWW